MTQTNRAEQYWQESQNALAAMQTTMQEIALTVQANPPQLLKRNTLRDMHRNTARFMQKFAMLEREQRRRIRNGW